HYSGTDLHHFYERIHPGTPFIYLSFLVLLWWRGNLVHNLVRLARTHTVFVALLCVYIGLLVYLVLRSGAAGIAFLVDTHLPVPMA
ncbi:hypothetical protein VJI72_08610, partial [Parvimonas micra]|uniref:hypothetical protein n=1 Tax=Parvimonas micra TaxID=33033 RepID=UPI002B499DCE